MYDVLVIIVVPFIRGYPFIFFNCFPKHGRGEMVPTSSGHWLRGGLRTCDQSITGPHRDRYLYTAGDNL